MELALSPFCTVDDVVTELNYKEEEPLRGYLGYERYHTIQPYNHMSAKELMQYRFLPHLRQAGMWQTYFKFTIVREPLDTTVSQYYYKFRNEKNLPDINLWFNRARLNKDFKLAPIRNWEIYTVDDVPIVDDYIEYSSYSGPGSKMYADCERISKKLNLPENLADLFFKSRAKTSYRGEDPIFSKESLEYIEQITKKEREYTGIQLAKDRFSLKKTVML